MALALKTCKGQMKYEVQMQMTHKPNFFTAYGIYFFGTKS